MTHFLSPPGSGKSQKHYLCVYGIDSTEQTATDRSAAQALLGVRHVPPRAGTGHPLGARRTRYAGPDAHGGGKSLTYQIPGLASEGVCIVVTPLIALMKDQVDRLRKLGIRALAIHSGLSARQIDIDLDNCVYGDVKFLYVAPERARIRGLPPAGAANERIASRRR